MSDFRKLDPTTGPISFGDTWGMSAVETVARTLHAEHAKYLEGTAPFERCPNRATELRIAADILAALGLA